MLRTHVNKERLKDEDGLNERDCIEADEHRLLLAALYRSRGWSLRKIAVLLNCSRNRIREYCDKAPADFARRIVDRLRAG